MELILGTQADYNAHIVASDREWSASLYYWANGVWNNADDKCVKSFQISDYSTDGSNITMGTIVGGKLTLSLMNVISSVAYALSQGTHLKLRLTLNSSKATNEVAIQSKVFVIDNKKLVLRKSGTYDISITAYDYSYIMTDKYVATADKLSAKQILTEISNKYGFSIGTSVDDAIANLDGLSPTIYTPLADFTCKQTIGYMAGCYGCFAYFDSYNTLQFGWYEDNGDYLTTDRIYNGSAYVAEMEEREIVMLETGTSDNPIVIPDNAKGYSINFENPYIRAEQAQAIYDEKIAGGKIYFKIGKLSYKGNPLNSPKTIITVGDMQGLDYPFYIMKRTLRYDGGLGETIECQGESETTINYKLTSPTQQKINRALSKMEEAIKNATDIITQTKGSFFELIPIDENDPSKGNSGWKLYSTEIGSNNVILANSSGIGFSSNGGQSFDAAAIYIDNNGKGHINANEVVFDNLTANSIKTGVLTSVNGSAIFDLNQNLFKVGSENYFTQIQSGSLTQHASNGKLVGGLVPVGTAAGRDISLYYNSAEVGTGVGVHEQDQSGTFKLIAGFKRDLVTINAPINTSGNITVNNGTITTNNGDTFAGLTHTRTIKRNNVVSSAKIKAGVGDWSDVYAPIDSTYMIYGGLQFKIYEGKSYYTSKLASANSVPMTEWIDPKGSTALKVSFYYHSYGFAFFDFVYKTKEQVGTDYSYVALDKFLKSTKGDIDKTEGYYSGEFAIPENAALISIWAKPENAASNYWVGWRNVKGGLYLGTKFSASLELLDSNNNVASRIDVIDSEGEACGALRMKTSSGTSSLLELGNNELWYNGVGILEKLSNLENRLSAIENQ